ncbi:hypothetical protein C0416_04660 [bacterium]|nr:hypothetical protein [bacterium]
MSLSEETIKKLDIAKKIYDEMDNLQRNVVGEFVIPIVNIQMQINELAEAAKSGEVCKNCEGGCCTNGIEYELEIEEFLYAISRMTEEELKKVYETVKTPHAHSQCSFVGEDGCVIPKNVRPINCKAFHCKEIPGGLDIMGGYGKQLRTAYTHYLETLDAIGIYTT